MKLSSVLSQKVIALIDLNFDWTQNEVTKVTRGYRNKMNIKQLAKLVRRPVDEVAILLIHLGREEKI